MKQFFTILLATCCLTAVGQVSGDFDGDNCVTTIDLIQLLGNWGACLDLNCESVEFWDYSYPTVEAGGNCWFAENLRSTRYANGDLMLTDLTSSEWSIAQIGATCIYNDSIEYLDDYGRLYNFMAVKDERGLCPSGWHVPSAFDWETVIMDFGGQFQAGTEMRSAEHWLDGIGNNESGLTLKPGGWRDGGYYYYQGDVGFYWVPDELSFTLGGSSVQDAVFSLFVGQGSMVGFISTDNEHGHSIRCVKDAE